MDYWCGALVLAIKEAVSFASGIVVLELSMILGAFWSRAPPIAEPGQGNSVCDTQPVAAGGGFFDANGFVEVRLQRESSNGGQVGRDGPHTRPLIWVWSCDLWRSGWS